MITCSYKQIHTHTHTHTGLYYEHACNAVYQEMQCFHEASKLNQSHSPKTFIAPSRQGDVAIQQSGAAQSTNLANKSAVTQSKVSVASKPGAGTAGGGNMKQSSGASIGLFQLIGIHPHRGVNIDLPLKKALLVDFTL